MAPNVYPSLEGASDAWGPPRPLPYSGGDLRRLGTTGAPTALGIHHHRKTGTAPIPKQQGLSGPKAAEELVVPKSWRHQPQHGRGLRVPKRRGLVNPKTAETPEPKPPRPRWPQSGGFPLPNAARAWFGWSHCSGRGRPKVAAGLMVLKQRRPPPKCCGRVGVSKAAEAPFPKRHRPVPRCGSGHKLAEEPAPMEWDPRWSHSGG